MLSFPHIAIVSPVFLFLWMNAWRSSSSVFNFHLLRSLTTFYLSDFLSLESSYMRLRPLSPTRPLLKMGIFLFVQDILFFTPPSPPPNIGLPLMRLNPFPGFPENQLANFLFLTVRPLQVFKCISFFYFKNSSNVVSASGSHGSVLSHKLVRLCWDP